MITIVTALFLLAASTTGYTYIEPGADLSPDPVEHQSEYRLLSFWEKLLRKTYFSSLLFFFYLFFINIKTAKLMQHIPPKLAPKKNNQTQLSEFLWLIFTKRRKGKKRGIEGYGSSDST
jgi:hypothetical protein